MQLNTCSVYRCGKFKLLLFSLICCLLSFAPAQEWIKTGITCIINTDFEQALKLYRDEINLRPQDYRAHFYLAAALNSRMVHFENENGQDQFDQAIDRTIEIIQQELRSENLPDTVGLSQYWFYLGSAYGYRAYNQGRNGKWLAALSNGLKATDYLQQAVNADSTMYDAYLGIGTYKYWRRSKLSFISWLPFFPDDREQGIRLIKKTADADCLSRDLAKHQLVYILLDYGWNDQAIGYGRQLVADYPRSQFMRWALAHAYYKSNEYPSAEKEYLCLAELIQEDQQRNLNHLLNCKYKLAVIYRALNDNTRCRQQCVNIVELYDNYSDKDKFDKIDQVRKLLHQVQAETGTSATTQ
jgi:tetratricopeptide (TPR) repeat protein